MSDRQAGSRERVLTADLPVPVLWKPTTQRAAAPAHDVGSGGSRSGQLRPDRPQSGPYGGRLSEVIRGTGIQLSCLLQVYRQLRTPA